MRNELLPVTVDTRDAARRLGVSQSFLEKLRFYGRPGPPYLKLGSRVLYRIADLEQWAADNAHGGGQ